MTAIPTMMLNDVAKTPVPLTTLEAQGYTHLSWKCTACGLECARGFQLLRIRGRLRNDSSIASVARKLRCPRVAFIDQIQSWSRLRRAEGSRTGDAQVDRERLARLQAVRTSPLSRAGSSPVAGSQMSVDKRIGGLIGLMLGTAVQIVLACSGIEVRRRFECRYEEHYGPWLCFICCLAYDRCALPWADIIG
jgi:hypothetical protein